VYRDALHNLMETNTVWYEGDHVIRAGADYARPWTRDGSLNGMMAGSLLEPGIAENTLWHITEKRQTVRGQWWDRMIWVIAAWHHYKVTGDRDFLRQACDCAAASLENHRREFFVEEYGLFRGPSHLCDGIAGYPDPPAVNTDGQSSYCEDYPNLVYIMPTSLQAIYYGAYRAAADMARSLQREQSEITRWEGYAAELREQATRHLWVPELHRYGYFVHGKGPKAGQLETHQEGAGLAYALLFGLADEQQSREIMDHFHNQPYGMTCVWPHFARFSDQRPGRHNVLVWPQMNAYWALATLRRGRPDLFHWEFDNVTRLLHSTSPDIREIYDSIHGTPNGGIQSGKQWEATHHQTWGATGYLGMIYRGIFGLQFDEDGIRFQPNLPAKWGVCRLNGLIYRDAKFNITLTGSGSQVARFELDGEVRRPAALPATTSGEHTVHIHLQ
jgi:glycogen debranching enzyme